MQDFKFSIDDISFFEKSDAEEGKTRRIGGIASIETSDRQNETLLQRGLDFSEFVNHGWFNDNHLKDTAAVLGYPDSAKFFKKGETLPDGRPAKASGHWVEGYLLNGYQRADEIWNLAKALKGTPRKLGFSVEGKIQQRDSINKSIVSKAVVRNVAITNCPVNTDAQMDILAKSLTMGTPTPGEAITEPKTGEGAGQILSKESLEKKKRKQEKEDEDKAKKSLSDSEVYSWFANRYPKASPSLIGRMISLAKELKANGKI